MTKIIIIGCGLGGLAFTLKYKGNAEIEIYEKKKKEELGFPWCDTIRLSSFTDNGFKVPEFALNKKKRFFITIPDSKGKIIQKKKIETERAEIDRTRFIEFFIREAEGKAKIEFERGISDLIVVSDSVKGVIFDDGSVEYADLVIDASGAFSSIRKLLPLKQEDFSARRNETMFYYRGYFLPNSDEPEPEYDSVYLKTMGENAISWVRTAPNGCLDVFIAHMGEITDEFVQRVFEDLTARNPRLGLTPVFVKTGKLALRFPLSRIVFDNFAFVGDSAYMSMPMTGSGMDNAIYAGVLLCEVVEEIKNDDYSVKNLWKYQSKYFRSLGSNMYVADMLLRYGMQLETQDVIWFFNEFMGETFSVKDVKRKLKSLFEKRVLTAFGFGLLGKMIKAKSLAMMTPLVYEKGSVDAWVDKYDSFIREK